MVKKNFKILYYFLIGKTIKGKRKFMENKLEEFAHIFGKGAVAHLGKSLLISHAQQ